MSRFGARWIDIQSAILSSIGAVQHVDIKGHLIVDFFDRLDKKMNIRASSCKGLKQANLQMLVHRATAQLLNIERPEPSGARKKPSCDKIMRLLYILYHL